MHFYDPYYARTHTLVHNMHSMQGIMVSKILLLAKLVASSRVACVPPLYRYVHKIHDMRSIHSNPSSRPWGSPPRRTSRVSAHQPTHQTSIPLRPPNLPTIRAEHPHPPEPPNPHPPPPRYARPRRGGPPGRRPPEEAEEEEALVRRGGGRRRNPHPRLRRGPPPSRPTSIPGPRRPCSAPWAAC